MVFRDEMFRRSLVTLKADIVRANVLVNEANFLAEEMGKQTRFSVTLQIPPANLSPNRKVSVFFSILCLFNAKALTVTCLFSFTNGKYKIYFNREVLLLANLQSLLNVRVLEVRYGQWKNWKIN
jgi:hypothetical protein